MRSLVLSLLFSSSLPFCPGQPPDPDPGEVFAQIEVPADSPSIATLDVTWSPALPGKFLRVTDEAGNDFTTATQLDRDHVNALYLLPAGRTLTASAGYTDPRSGQDVTLDTATFTTVASGPCDTSTLGYSASIASPMRGVVRPPGRLLDSQMVMTWMPDRWIPDRYLTIYDETAGHEVLFSDGLEGYALAAGHVFTFEIGWYCLAESVERTIPLAAARFSTSR
jgi:hypothetical protein